MGPSCPCSDFVKISTSSLSALLDIKIENGSPRMKKGLGLQALQYNALYIHTIHIDYSRCSDHLINLWVLGSGLRGSSGLLVV